MPRQSAWWCLVLGPSGRMILFSGSREWPPEKIPAVKAYVEKAVLRAITLEWSIVVGDAPGVDAWVCDAALANDWKYYTFVMGIADKPRNGWTGPYENTCFDGLEIRRMTKYLERDREMVKLAQTCLAVWNGESRGTKYTYDHAVKQGLDAHLVRL
jgi:hypothetical protein